MLQILNVLMNKAQLHVDRTAQSFGMQLAVSVPCMGVVVFFKPSKAVFNT